MPPPSATRGPVRVLLYLLLGLIVVDLVVAFHRPLWTAYDPHEYATRLSNCRSAPHDLVVVGGSTVSEGVDSRRLAGVNRNGQSLDRAFNLGMSGGTATDVWHAVKHGLREPPRLVIYGITASDLNDSRDEPAGVQALMDVTDVAACCRQRPDRSEWFVRHWMFAHLDSVWQLWRYRNGIRLWAADLAEGLAPGLFADVTTEARNGLERSGNLRVSHGFAPFGQAYVGNLARVPPKARKNMPFKFLNGYRVGGHLACVHRLLDWGRAHGVEILLVDMPVSGELEQRYPREFALYRETLATTAREQGVRVLNAGREKVGLTDSDFGDLVHLNASGAEKLSHWMRSRIEDAP